MSARYCGSGAGAGCRANAGIDSVICIRRYIGSRNADRKRAIARGGGVGIAVDNECNDIAIDGIAADRTGNVEVACRLGRIVLVVFSLLLLWLFCCLLFFVVEVRIL